MYARRRVQRAFREGGGRVRKIGRKGIKPEKEIGETGAWFEVSFTIEYAAYLREFIWLTLIVIFAFLILAWLVIRGTG